MATWHTRDDLEVRTGVFESKLLVEVRKYGGAAGKQVLEPALTMYCAARDKATPAWARTAIYGALGYFIFPVDAIPDLIPIAGYSDDLGVLAAALAVVAAHIKTAHKKRAKETTKEWLG